MRSVTLRRKGQKYIIVIDADGHKREYVESDLEVAKARANKLKMMLCIR